MTCIRVIKIEKGLLTETDQKRIVSVTESEEWRMIDFLLSY